MRFALAVLLLISLSNSSWAEIQPNPFVSSTSGKPPAPTAAGGGLPDAPVVIPEEAASTSFADNKPIFESIEVVGRRGKTAVLRYPSSTSSTDGSNVKYVKVSNGGRIYLAGRRYSVEIDDDEESDSVRILSGNGKIIWEGGMAVPRSYIVAPTFTDQNYNPPLSAGVGVGESKASAASQMIK